MRRVAPFPGLDMSFTVGEMGDALIVGTMFKHRQDLKAEIALSTQKDYGE